MFIRDLGTQVVKKKTHNFALLLLEDTKKDTVKTDKRGTEKKKITTQCLIIYT